MLSKQLPGYSVQQHNIVVDALGGCSASVRSNIKLFGSRGDCPEASPRGSGIRNP